MPDFLCCPEAAVKFRNIRHDLAIREHGLVEAVRKAGTRGKDDPGASGEFEVTPEHVEGLVHQAYGESANYEPVDAEAKAAVAEAQKPPEEPAEEPVEIPAPPAVPPVAPTVPAAPVTEGTK